MQSERTAAADYARRNSERSRLLRLAAAALLVVAAALGVLLGLLPAAILVPVSALLLPLSARPSVVASLASIIVYATFITGAIGPSSDSFSGGVGITLGASLLMWILVFDSQLATRFSTLGRTEVRMMGLIFLFLVLTLVAETPLSYEWAESQAGVQATWIALMLASVASIAMPGMKRGPLLWWLFAIPLIGFGMELVQDNTANQIWVARAFALAAVAALLLPWPGPLRVVTFATFVGLSFSQGSTGPALSALIGAALVITLHSRVPPWVRSVVVLPMGLAAVFEFTFLNFTGSDPNVSSRGDTAACAVDLPLTAFGIGFAPPDPCGTLEYIHNAPVEMLVGLGLVGLTLWVVLVLVMGYYAHRASLLPLYVTALTFSFWSGTPNANPEYWIIGCVAIAILRTTTPRASQLEEGTRHSDETPA